MPRMKCPCGKVFDEDDGDVKKCTSCSRKAESFQPYKEGTCVECDEQDDDKCDRLHCSNCCWCDDYISDYDDDREDRFEFDDDFADPGGNSALRAETPDNPRDRPCPTCGDEDVLTREDVMRGYQCDSCANAAERGGY